VETSLFVKAGPWHRITGASEDGKAITGCGRNVYPSPMCSSIDTVEAGNGCPECLPEKASAKEVERLVTIREQAKVYVQTNLPAEELAAKVTAAVHAGIVHAGEKIVPAKTKRTRKA
jgi:hypothetical protein